MKVYELGQFTQDLYQSVSRVHPIDIDIWVERSKVTGDTMVGVYMRNSDGRIRFGHLMRPDVAYEEQLKLATSSILDQINKYLATKGEVQ